MSPTKKGSPRPDCDTCAQGRPHPDCGGHRKDGQPCGRSPKKGFKVCRFHGGSAPQVIAAAERRLVAKAIGEAMATFGKPIPESSDPDLAGSLLLEEIRWIAGHVRWLRDIIGALEPDALVWGDKASQHQEGHGPEGPVDVRTTSQAAGVNVWIDIYHQQQKLLVAACKVAIDAKIAERRVQLAEQEGERQGQWLRLATASLNLTADQLRRVMADGLANLHVLRPAS